MKSTIVGLFTSSLISLSLPATAETVSPYPEDTLGRCGVFVFGDDSTLAYVSQASNPKGILHFHSGGGEKISLGLTTHKIEAKNNTSLQNGDKMTLVYGKAENKESSGFKAALRGTLREVCDGTEKSCGGVYAILDGEMAVEGPSGVKKYSIEALNGCISLK